VPARSSSSFYKKPQISSEVWGFVFVGLGNGKPVPTSDLEGTFLGIAALNPGYGRLVLELVAP